jgi:hypothetical protein
MERPERQVPAVHDPLEGTTTDGRIITGADRHRVPPPFEPVLADAVDAVAALGPGCSLYVYGSVATGCARLSRSDVDLLAIDVPPAVAAAIGERLSDRHRLLCRAVELGALASDQLEAGTDEAYGNRVFLRHYCVHLVGPARRVDVRGYPADERAARGFNGDICAHACRWSDSLGRGADPAGLARRIARKTLLAVAGLVSVRDRTWTTDRRAAADRYADVAPSLAPGLGQLVSWIDGAEGASAQDVRRALADTVAPVVRAFEREIGTWP